MMRRIIAATLLLILAILAWLWLFPSEESRIKQRLQALAEDANEAGSDVAGLASAARVATYFTEDVTIEPRTGPAVRGRQIVMSIAAQLKNAAETTEVMLTDVAVTVSADRTSANARVTATITRNEGSPDATKETYPFVLTMQKVNGAWLISHVTSPETLR
jgi:ketosteroid isomerase-like protein